MRIVPMTTTFAADLTTWEYAEPYGQYSLTDADPAFFTGWIPAAVCGRH